MNDDTPQVFGDDTHDHPRDAYPHDPAPPSDQDGEDFPLFEEPKKEWLEWAPQFTLPPEGPEDQRPVKELPQASEAVRSAVK